MIGYSDRRYAMGQGVEVGQLVRYYAGFRFPPQEIHKEEALLPYPRSQALIIVPDEGDPCLLMSRADEALVRRQSWIRDVRAINNGYRSEDRLALLAKLAAKDLASNRSKKGQRVGIAGVGVPWGLYSALLQQMPRTQFVACTEEVDKLRMVKSQNELQILRKAAQIADAGVEAFYKTAKEGATEYEVHQAVERAMFDAGGDNPWSVIMSGPRSYISYISPDFTQRQLKSGDMVHTDIGSEFAGYHSDVQPVAIIGGPRTGQVSLLRTNAKVLRAMIGATKPGTSEKDVVGAAIESAKGEPFGNDLRMSLFGHGYGVGLDPPNLTAHTLAKSKASEITLREKMVLCYEPGIFVPGVGGTAIEDQVIINQDGCEVMTGCLRHAERLLEEFAAFN